ncbi:trimethyllysine dioxygenase TmlH [Aspergillus bertholletiae]|uniref:Trimethyllysine dioxygenase n=1 Tax=Aspergillus bertholletiae TaxID=1226010 RepID=A0A5N7ARW2_9EURO|nr:trimethyllysine dioxygenase TmlH [Aspergillus bertholletiae]
MSAPGVGFEYPPQEVSWLKRDALLFANSIGAKSDELHFLYELHPDFAIFPTYSLILPFKHTDQETIDFYARTQATPIPGVPKFDSRRAVDGQRKITILKPLPPTSAGKKFQLRNKVIGVYDKGKAGSVVETEQSIVDENGQVYTKTVSSGFMVGQGNWGGPKGPSAVNYPPPQGKKPDAVHVVQTTAETALLYRLNGDYNPLHATPEPGKKMGFGGVIIHGLFSWNSAAHGILRELGGSDPKNLREFQARFASPVLPGDKLTTEMWRTGNIEDGFEEVRFVTTNNRGKAGSSPSLSKCLRPSLSLSRSHVASRMMKRMESTLAKPSADTSSVEPSVAEQSSVEPSSTEPPSTEPSSTGPSSTEPSSTEPSSAEPSRTAAKPEAPNPLEYVFPFINAKYKSQPITMKISRTATSQFGRFWLRDNCQCSKCVHPDTRQRSVDTFSIPPNVTPKNITYEGDIAKVQWSDGHQGVYPVDWLKAHVPIKSRIVDNTRPNKKMRKFMAHKTSSTSYPTVLYEDVMSNDEGLCEWLHKIYLHGFCFVKGVPVDPESTKTLLERISFIRHTHYGGFWDFTADLTFKDTAYTTEFLGAHTDNTYFTDPARLQLFHLLSHTDGDGGASLLVDGFWAAKIMRAENPQNYQMLAAMPQPFHSSGNEDTCIQPAEQMPIFKIHPQYNYLYQIRWNNYDRSAKKDWTLDQQNRWYNAASHFNHIISRKKVQIWTQLEPGTALIFDNWRMLHGRSEFTGKRRMCGGYINSDDFVSRYRLLRFGREKMLNNIGNFIGRIDNPNYFL